MATVNISDYVGEVSGTDWSPAFNAAFDDLKLTGGRIYVDQDVQWETSIGTAQSGYIWHSGFEIVGDGGSVITAKGTSSTFLFGINGNHDKVTLRGLNIIGFDDDSQVSDPNYYSCDTLINGGAGGHILIEDCTIGGIGASSAIMHTTTGGGPAPVVIRNSRISGVAGHSLGMLHFAGSGWVTMENVVMFDYHNFLGVYYNKQGYGPNWITAIYTLGPTGNSFIPAVELRNVRTDEGSNFGYIEGYERVIIENCAANANGGGPSLHLKDVTNATITNYWAGYTGIDTPAIKLETCGDVVITGLQVHNGVKRIEVDAFTRLRVYDSPNVIIDRV